MTGRGVRRRGYAAIAAVALAAPGGVRAQLAAQAAPVAVPATEFTRATDVTLPPSALSVRTAAGWTPWWQSARAPVRWPATSEASGLSRAVHWHSGAPGIEWGDVSLAGTGEAWRTKLVVVRLDPRQVALRLDTAFAGALHADWSLARAPAGALMAVNAGQFVSSLPWGWVVLDGREYLPPGFGPTSSAFVVDSAGRAHWIHGAAIQQAVRAGVRAVWAFQSYPTLLEGGAVSAGVRAGGRGIDVAHRDARLAIGTLPDGRVVVAMTRFDALGEPLGFVPFGLTAPEMAGVMGALGATDAMMLDGGISAQLLIRGSDGGVLRWPGVRRVPLALVAMERAVPPRGDGKMLP